MTETTEMTGTRRAAVTAVRVENVRYVYDRTVVSLYGVSFSVNAGECVCVADTNGSGKSTLLQVIAGAKPDAGSVTVDGKAQTYGGGIQRTGLVFHEPNDQLFMPVVWKDAAFGILKRGVSLETARASVEATALANS